MKHNLWIIIVIVAGFLGFMMGYSMPPFLETGVGGGKGKAAGGPGRRWTRKCRITTKICIKTSRLLFKEGWLIMKTVYWVFY